MNDKGVNAQAGLRLFLQTPNPGFLASWLPLCSPSQQAISTCLNNTRHKELTAKALTKLFCCAG